MSKAKAAGVNQWLAAVVLALVDGGHELGMTAGKQEEFLQRLRQQVEPGEV